MEVINTIGRRKAAVARVYLKAGKGDITINGRPYKEYFPQPNVQFNIEDPFNTLDVAGQFDVKINVKGGGFKGQAEAIRMAISRALSKVSEDYRSPLKAKKRIVGCRCAFWTHEEKVESKDVTIYLHGKKGYPHHRS